MTDSFRPKWVDGPGDGERIDYDLVRDWAWLLDEDLKSKDYIDPYDVRSLARELLRVQEKLGREMEKNR